MAEAPVNVTKGGLEALFRRPKTEYVNKQGETVSVTPRTTDLVYIRACTGCKFTVNSKGAKCIIESCDDVRVEFEEPLIAGTLEVINSKDVTVSINPQDALPTVSADHCENLHLYFYDPRGIGGIYTVKCHNVVVHLQPPYKQEHVLDTPADSEDQFVSQWKKGKMVTAKVIREGAGYATTAEKLAQDLRREKELERRLEEHLRTILKFSKPEEQKKGQSKGEIKPPETSTTQQGGKTKSGGPPQPQQDKKPSKPPAKEGSEGKGEERAEPPKDFETALQAKRGELKPTETVERTRPVVGTGRVPNIPEDEAKREYFDTEQQLKKKLDRTAEWLRQSKHVIVFTGAGISTSSGIADYRSSINTVLDTGPGVWELMAHGQAPPKGRRSVPLLKALPSPTHMAIVKLHEAGLAKYTVSQNVDGLHRRSGIPPTEMAELHGNTNLETCVRCSRQYLRDFDTREAVFVHDHKTSRQCDDPKCRGELHDSIINFGEMLPEAELRNAIAHARKADMCIVLGSSLRVRPACQIPEVVQAGGGKVVICNLQRIPQYTPDSRTMQVFCMCDQFMTGLMERLGLEVPKFVLKRRAKIVSEKTEDHCTVTVTGLDVREDTPYSFIKSVTVKHGDDVQEVSSEPLSVSLPPSADQLTVTLHFQGHYGEPPVEVPYSVSIGSRVIQMGYDVVQREWSVE